MYSVNCLRKGKKYFLRHCFYLYYQIDTSYLSLIRLPIKKKRTQHTATFNGTALDPLLLAVMSSASSVLSSLLKKLERLTLYQIIGPFGYVSLFVSTK